MGIDYVLDVDCVAKQRLTVEGIVNMVKARSRAEMVIAMARQEGDQRPPSEITFGVVLNRMGKLEQQDVSAQQLLDQAAALDTFRSACTECAANRESTNGFGCYDSINYPVEPDAEQFLLSRLPTKLESAAGHMFSAAMQDFEWDGETAAKMRAQGETFFRARKPPVRKWSGLSITGDQLFHMMFHVGPLNPMHAKMLCLFFGLLRVGDDDGDESETVEPLSASGEQMIRFLNTLAFAASEEVDVLIDG